jgi:hypothetical protein
LERLTFEGNFCDIAQCRDSACRQDGTCTQRLVWERLKAYEDAGLSPQACAEAREIEETLSGYDYSISRMVELMKADKDGRVLILPCAPDAIYWEKVGGILAQSRFEGLHVYEDGTIKYAGYGMEICAEDIGKTVFLSREEAEKALQEMEGKKDGV